MRRRVWVLGVVVLLFAVSACSGGGKKDARPPAIPGPNPDVIPAVITPAYVNAVFKVLNHIDGDATRLLAVQRVITPAVQTDYRAIYNDPMYASELAAASESIQQGVIKNVRTDAGDAVTTVVRLISASPRCIFVETATDLSAVFVEPRPSPASEYYELSPKQHGADPEHLNPTPWAISFNAAYLQPTEVASRC
jgi:hypothetical protein